MARVKALAPKFKRVETAIRKVLQDYAGVAEAIDATLEGKRTDAEIALLRALKEEASEAHKQAQKLVFRLYEATQQ